MTEKVAPAAPAEVGKPAALPSLVNPGTWTATASSQETFFSPRQAIDGSLGTRWSSEFKDGQWWMVDFGRDEVIGKIAVHWETAYGRSYRVLISPNGTDWVEVSAQTNGMGGTDFITFEPQVVRQVKIDCLQKATQWGFSLLEVEFNPAEPVGMEATASSGGGDYGPQLAVDGKPDTRWCSNTADDEWWQVRFAEPQVVAGVRIAWETAFAEKYEVAVSMDGHEWKKVYDATDGDGRTDLLFFTPVETRYVRIHCRQRGTGWGNSIWEVHFIDGAHAPVVSASSARENAAADLALDGDPETAWHSAGGGEQSLTVDLANVMSIGGVDLYWGPDYATSYSIECSSDGTTWVAVADDAKGNGGKDFISFAGRDARWLRVNCRADKDGRGYAIAHLEFKGGDEQATPIRLYQALARGTRNGLFPMWLGRQQEFWTITGVHGDTEESLLGETGVVEPRKNGFSVMPVVLTGGKLVTYADVKLTQKLEGTYLPLPTVTWDAGSWKMEISAVSAGPAGASYTLVRYRLRNEGAEAFAGQLGLALRPVQLNPIWQHGGMSPIHEAECVRDGALARVRINGMTNAAYLGTPKAVGASNLETGDAIDFLEKGETPATPKASDTDGKTSVAALYDVMLPAGDSLDVVVAYPLHDGQGLPEEVATNLVPAFEKTWAQQKQTWAGVLATPVIRIPEKRLIDILKSNYGYTLLTRDDMWFKPGPRNYNHAWMRDGALSGVAMLRMGRADLVAEYLRKLPDVVADFGWVPHIVMEGGNPATFNSDPNSGEGQEYDSQGEFAFIVRQYYDYTGDEQLLRHVYPKLVKAMEFGREIRKRRLTDEYKNDPKKRVFYGILPLSNSHEGYYPAKHSYWDDLWMLKGLKDAAYLADRLGMTNDSAWMRVEEQDLRKCMLDSMRAVIERDQRDFIPGCAELGDEDPTSTSVAIMACDEADALPQDLLKNTFDRYYGRLQKRFRGEPDTYTPYENRNIDVFVRLGQRDRALALARNVAEFGIRPYTWGHMAEVVHANPRAAAYIGDMPHTWCGSDYMNAIRSMFAYEKDHSLVLAAGVDPAWLKQGVEVGDLPTQFGLVSYSMKESSPGEIVFTAEGRATPPQGFVLPLPASLAGLGVEINGAASAVKDGAVRFGSLPARVRLFTPPPAAEAAPFAAKP